jgi:hypothetical protein
MLTEKMENFISVTLSVDGAAPDPPAIKDSMRGSSKGRAEVEAGLRELLRTRELTTLDWVKMTHVEFDAEEELYAYLQKMYDYLFRGAEELPEIPED